MEGSGGVLLVGRGGKPRLASLLLPPVAYNCTKIDVYLNGCRYSESNIWIYVQALCHTQGAKFVLFPSFLLCHKTRSPAATSDLEI